MLFVETAEIYFKCRKVFKACRTNVRNILTKKNQIATVEQCNAAVIVYSGDLV